MSATRAKQQAAAAAVRLRKREKRQFEITHIAVVQGQGSIAGAKLVVLLLGDRHSAKKGVARENQFKPERQKLTST